MSKFTEYLSNSPKYYDTPPQFVFEDIKQKAIQLWNSIDEYWEDNITKIENVKDNAWYIVALFDENNQRKLWEKLKTEVQHYIININK
jgi:hypothetical protein